MSGQMVQNAVKIIESALMGAARHRAIALAAPAYAPFADGGGIIPGFLQDGTQSMGIFNGMVKAVIPHHAGSSLVYAQQQGSACRSTHGRGGLMAAQLNPFTGHG